jgi:DNA-binding response OmpR family regulator
MQESSMMIKKSRTLLLVDDEPANLHILKEILQNDYELIFAKDGASALEIARERRPDLILLDVILPEMNGYEVCLALKHDSRTVGIPVIFVSAISDNMGEAHGFDVGGVDYITKPVNQAIVRARVATHLALLQELQETLRAKATLRETNAELETYKRRSEYELSIARELIDHMIRKSSAQAGDVELWIQSAASLSGDMVLTQNDANGRSYILLADAMGHGLPAALPLMPIVQAFSEMARDGFPLPAIVREMNKRIVELIPFGNFVAATLMVVDQNNRSAEIWNGGNPPALLLNSKGEMIRKISARHLALGVLKDAELDTGTELLNWQDKSWISLYSDGLIEAENAAKVSFGEEQLNAALRGNSPHQSLKKAILAHLGGQNAHDDISIATVALNA